MRRTVSVDTPSRPSRARRSDKRNESGAEDLPGTTLVLPSAAIGPPQNQVYQVTNITYTVLLSARLLSKSWRTLMDRGANGCIVSPRDFRITVRYGQWIDLNGIADHKVSDLELVTADTYVDSSKGPLIGKVHYGAAMHDGKSILCPGQLEYWGCTIQDKPFCISGEQPFLQTPYGHKIPMVVVNGLAYLKFRPPTDEELNDPSIPHVDLTSPHGWDPACLDSQPPSDWCSGDQSTLEDDPDSALDAFGNVKPDDNEDDIEDTSDRQHRAIDRGTFKAFLATLIEPELEAIDDDDYWPWEYPPPLDDRSVSSSDSESSEIDDIYETNDEIEQLRSCYVQTRSQVRTSQTPVEGDTTAVTPGDGEDFEKQPTKETQVPPSTSSASPSMSPAPTVDPPTVPLDEPPGSYRNSNPAKEFTGLAIPPISSKGGANRKRKADELRRFFIGANDETIQKTLDATTQYATRGKVMGRRMKKQILSPNPILNVPRRQEDVATDTIYGSVPAIDCGSTAAQLFIGRQSHFRTIHPAGTSDASFVHTLMDEIRKRGAMNTLISDNAKAEISERIHKILRTFAIDDKQSEPYRGNQNKAELGWRDVKAKSQMLLDTSGAPGSLWLEACKYVCQLMNHTATEALGWRTPWEWIFGETPDLTAFLQFVFYEPVYYLKYDAKYPEDPTECVGRFVGVSEDVGHGMTYRILTESGKIICRAVARTARIGKEMDNARANEAAPEVAPKPKPTVMGFQSEIEPQIELDTAVEAAPFYNSIRQDIKAHTLEDDVLSGGSLPTTDIIGLLNRTFITNPDDEGEQHRAKIVSAEPTDQTDADGATIVYRFKCKHGDKTWEEVCAYSKMLEWCDRDLDKDDMYKIERITDHRPLKTTDSKGKVRTVPNQYEVLVSWGSATTTWEPMTEIFNDDPVSVSVYALKNNLLNQPGWKRCKPYVKNSKRFARMVHQARLKNFRNKPRYKYGFQVPRSHEEAVFIDEKNGNTKWQDSEKLEISQLMEYDTFKSLGLNAPVPEGYKKIPCHMVYDVKHDGRHKSRFVAGGHRTDTPVDSVYSGVVSLQGVRLVTFIAELNDLELWGTDIGNAYLESYTTEKVCFKAGGEFGELAGHTFVMIKAQYGLRSSGLCWHNKLFDVLTDMGFFPSRAESDIWIKDCGDHYEYIATYVDDLLIASRNPQAIIDMLEAKPHQFKLKGTGPVKFHLGCNFERDPDGTLKMSPNKYIDRIEAQYVALFGENPPHNGCKSPLDPEDHPEMDTTALLDDEGIRKFQSLIGALQWAISLGRFDISVAVMTMSSYRTAPRIGHLERLKRVTGYLVKMRQGAIRIRTEKPDYSQVPNPDYDWTRTVYGNVSEELPKDAPEPKGKPVILTAFVDANLHHDLVTGRAVTGVLHLVNQTPFEWFCKKQATVEAATYGSEFVAAKLATEQAMAARITLRYLGVPVEGPTYMFGDNGSVVTSSTIPHSPLKKRHHALAYHLVREAIAAGIINFSHLPGDLNPADVMTKHWSYSKIWAVLQAVMFWTGDTADLLPSQ